MIRIHNSLTGRKEVFTPIDPGVVRMYVCGITVYDYCHIGHARSQVAFDVVRRYLEYRGFNVVYARNITDIDDRIITRAAENGESVESLTARFIAAMDEDFAAIGIAKPQYEPRATEHVPGILRMIEALIARGHAYVAADGDVQYSVASFDGYGRLSGKRLQDLRAGARVEIDAAKRDPLDFVLWKASKPGEPQWPSPWGPGRPGWHIECSAMSTALLGNHFDIHGGGLDLKFPHHENEIAQTCGATGGPFANVWMHNGFVNIDDEKMSKSLGNFFTLRDVLPGLRHPEVMRYFLISSHYRGPIDYSPDLLEQSDAALSRLYNALRGLPQIAGELATARAHTARFIESMDDDFNTPEALAVLQGLAREINAARDRRELAHAGALGAELRMLARVLGLLTVDPQVWLKGRAIGAGLADEEIESLIAQRVAARRAKDWVESDRLRDLLTASGITLEDRPDGKTEWRRG